MIVACIPPGDTSWKAQDRLQGDLDLPLTDQGALQVESWARTLARLQLHTGYYAPGQTAKQSAEILRRVLKLRTRQRKELRALNLGLWQGLLCEDLKRKHPKTFRQWLDKPFDVCPPEGEPVPDLVSRIESFIDFLRRKHQNESVVVVCQSIVGCILHGLLRETDLHCFLSDSCSRSPEPWVWPAGS